MATTTRRPTQAQIAERTGVSISTVSRALADMPGIGESVRRQVRQAADEIGYRLRRPAAPRHRRRGVALVPVRRATGGLAVFYEGIVAGVRAAAAAAQFELDVRLINEAFTTPEEVRRHLSSADADSLMLIGIDPSEDLAAWLLERRLPVVLVNGADPEMRFSCVSPSNFYASVTATRRLLDAGHRRIVHLTHHNRHTIMERVRGFRCAVAEVSGAVGRVVAVPPRDPDPSAGVLALLDQGDPPTAAFCMNDLLAVDLLEALGRRGLRVPEEFAIVGFDDLPCAGMVVPRLTTMRVDRVDIGRQVMPLLLRQLESEGGPVVQIQTGTALVEGGTVGPRRPR